jgi:hypothetical protein
MAANNYDNNNNYNNNNYMNEMNNNNYDDNTMYEPHYYVGEHVDGYDRYGPIIVYHYISERARNGRNINTIDQWEYDMEIWPGDRYWPHAGRNKSIIMVEIDNIANRF